MKKQGFTFFLWRVLAHRLQRWAQVASLQVGEEVYVICQDSVSVEYSAGSGLNVYEVNEADAQSVDGDLPPADWLARVNRGSPTSWLTHVNKNALGDLQRQANAARVSAVLSPESEIAPSRTSFVEARVGENRSHAEREISYAEKESQRLHDGGFAGAYRDGVDVTISPPAPLMPFALSHSHTNVLLPSQRSAAPLFESGGIAPSLPQETARFSYLAQNNEAVRVSSPDREDPSLAAKKSTRVAPSQDVVNPSTLHQMTARPVLSQRENEPRVRHARARIGLPPEEGQEAGQRSLRPVNPFPWQERPPELPASFTVSRTSSPQDSSVSERMPGVVNPYRASEQVQTENHWPSLPEGFKVENEDWERAQSAWERQQRLDREQRGSSWNV